MNRQPDNDERAVAPVVGVALLIAITVILAAVVGSVIFGLSSDPGSAPQTTLSFSVDNTTDEIELNHEGGEPLDPDEIVVKDDSGVVDELDAELRAGQSENTGLDVNNYDQISVVWQDPESSAEVVLATFRP